jgi:hypothetical protein
LASPGELVTTESTVEELSDGLWTLRELDLDPQLLHQVESPVRVFAVSSSDPAPI